MREPSAGRRSILAGLGAAGLATTMPVRPARAQPAAQPRRGGTLVVAADGEPRNLNPAIVASNGVFYVASKVVEPLAEMSYAGDGLVPRLATSWRGSADGRSATVALREGVSWHDGRPFTSADVAFSALEVWRKLQNLGRVVFADLEAVETPDAATAVFRFAEHRPGEYYRLERNPAFRDAGRPWLDAIVYRVLPDRNAIAAALEANQIQLSAFSAVPLADLARIAAVPGIAVVPGGYEGITYQLTVEINHRRRELADARVRRAIAHAIDRRFVVDTIFLGYAKESNGPIPRFDAQFHDPAVDVPKFDVARANALLDEAGHRRGGDGIRFRLRLLPAPWFEQTRQMGDYLRQALRAVGIDAQVVANDTAAHTRAVYTTHDFDLAIGSPVYRNDPAISTTILYQGGLPAGVPFSNQYGYDDAAMNATIRAAARSVDAAERSAHYRAFQRLAAEQQPLIHVAEFTFVTVARGSVRNVADNPRWATSHWADVWLDA